MVTAQIAETRLDNQPELIIVEHGLDLSKRSMSDLGLKCIHQTRLMDDEGNESFQQCSQPPAARHAHCQEHVTAVSPQERRLYENLASRKTISDQFHLVSVGDVELKIQKKFEDGFILTPMSMTLNHIDHINDNYLEWEEIYELFTLIYGVQKKDPTYKFPEEKFRNRFGKPGRHGTWENVMMVISETMDQLYFDKDETWNYFKVWSLRVATAQGWTKINAEFLNQIDQKCQVTRRVCKKANIRPHDEEKPFYNADKEKVTNGRFIFPYDKVTIKL